MDVALEPIGAVAAPTVHNFSLSPALSVEEANYCPDVGPLEDLLLPPAVVRAPEVFDSPPSHKTQVDSFVDLSCLLELSQRRAQIDELLSRTFVPLPERCPLVLEASDNHGDDSAVVHAKLHCFKLLGCVADLGAAFCAARTMLSAHPSPDEVDYYCDGLCYDPEDVDDVASDFLECVMAELMPETSAMAADPGVAACL